MSTFRISASELVALCIDRGLTLETLPLDEYKAVCSLFDEGVFEAINLEACVMKRLSEGGPSPESVEAQIKIAKAKINEE